MARWEIYLKVKEELASPESFIQSDLLFFHRGIHDILLSYQEDPLD